MGNRRMGRHRMLVCIVTYSGHAICSLNLCRKRSSCSFSICSFCQSGTCLQSQQISAICTPAAAVLCSRQICSRSSTSYSSTCEPSSIRLLTVHLLSLCDKQLSRTCCPSHSASTPRTQGSSFPAQGCKRLRSSLPDDVIKANHTTEFRQLQRL
jgi:hypothetical protein